MPAVEADSFALQPIKGSCRGMAPSPVRVYYTPCQPSWDMVRVEVNEWHPGSTWGIPSLKVLGWVQQDDRLLSGVLGRVEAASRVLTSEQQPQDHSTTKLMTMMTHVENYRRTVLPQQLGAPDTLSRVISASQPLDSSKAAKTDRMSSLTSLFSLAVVGPAKTATGVLEDPVIPVLSPRDLRQAQCASLVDRSPNNLQEPTTSISKQKEGGVMAPAVPAIVCALLVRATCHAVAVLRMRSSYYLYDI